MKVGLIAIIIVGIGILAIASVFLVSSQESDIAEVEDTLDREIEPIETPDVQVKYDNLDKITNDTKWKPGPIEWKTSGPFQIDGSEYVLGQKIFLRTGGLSFEEKGQVVFLRPLNETAYKVYIAIPFDGAKKEAFNYYIEPKPVKAQEICSKDDIIGKWTIVFRGTDYPNLDFEIIDQLLPGPKNEMIFSKVVC